MTRLNLGNLARDVSENWQMLLHPSQGFYLIDDNTEYIGITIETAMKPTMPPTKTVSAGSIKEAKV